MCRAIQINGKQHYLWRAVDQDGDVVDVVDVYLQARRDDAAAKRFFKRVVRCYQGEPRKIVTDKLCSYGVAHRALNPETIHSTKQYENNRAEQSLGAAPGVRLSLSRPQGQCVHRVEQGDCLRMDGGFLLSG